LAKIVFNFYFKEKILTINKTSAKIVINMKALIMNTQTSFSVIFAIIAFFKTKQK